MAEGELVIAAQMQMPANVRGRGDVLEASALRADFRRRGDVAQFAPLAKRNRGAVLRVEHCLEIGEVGSGGEQRQQHGRSDPAGENRSAHCLKRLCQSAGSMPRGLRRRPSG